MVDRIHPLSKPLVWLALAVAAAFANVALAAEAPQRLRPDGIVGAVFLANSDSQSVAVQERFLEAAGGDEANILVIVGSDQPPTREDEEAILGPWLDSEAISVEFVWISNRAQADNPANLKKVRAATGVWIGEFDASQFVKSIRSTKLADELQALLDRGGALAVQGPACAALAGGMLLDRGSAKVTFGLSLLPDCVVDPQFEAGSGGKRLKEAALRRTRQIGIGLPAGATLEIRGREMQTVEGGAAYIALPPGTNWHQQLVALSERRHGDWNQLHRAARDRSDPNYLPSEPAAPDVPHGSLVIVGGGGMPKAVFKKFVELAGGPDARFVVFPTAMPEPVADGADATFLSRAGLKHVDVLPARELNEVDTQENLEILKHADGVWFGGGRQWRFVDAYEGTKTAAAIRAVLDRGGVIGGSSAGATIQGDYLVRGSPFSSDIMMCEGYERGLGLLPGVAIDQHFSARNRFADMTALMKKYPQFLGIGLDEATAIVVQGHMAEIIGKGHVHFYDRRREPPADQPDYDVAAAGDKYDLQKRVVIPGPKPEAKPDHPAEADAHHDK
jgi:cyanophycinase